jgi:hemin uptake protein HemP
MKDNFSKRRGAGQTPDQSRSAKRQPLLPEYDVRDLVGDGREASIVHEGERYRLRITSNNKLILTK